MPARRSKTWRASVSEPYCSSFGRSCHGGNVGFRAPQPGRNCVFLDLLQARGNTGLAEIFLRQNIGRNLRKLRGNINVRQTKHDRAIGILDLADGLAELNLRIGRLTGLGETTFDLHSPVSFVCSLVRSPWHRSKCPRPAAQGGCAASFSFRFMFGKPNVGLPCILC